LGRGFAHFEDGSLLEHLTQTNLGLLALRVVARRHFIHNIVGRQNDTTISREALRWIGSSKRPFFVVINYFDAHEPFMPPSRYFRRFSASSKPPNQFYFPEDVQLDPRQLQDEIDAYDASIAWVDDQMADFLQALQESGRLENTVVVITSDHGQEFQEHGFMFHARGLYWELIHSPLIIRLPGAAHAKQHFHMPVSLTWLPSTLLDLAGVRNADFPGPSLESLFRGDPEVWPYPVSEMGQFGDSPRFPSYYGPMKSVVTPGWHYIEGGKLGEELYRCCGDETANVAQTSAGRRLATIFRASLDRGMRITRQTLQVAESSSSISDASPMKKQQSSKDRRRISDELRALGYAR
jgi:arylsulfatase A-like enzyme